MGLDYLSNVPRHTRSLFIVDRILKHGTSTNSSILFMNDSFNKKISIQSLNLYENNTHIPKRASMGFFNCSRDMSWVGSNDFSTYVKSAEVDECFNDNGFRLLIGPSYDRQFSNKM